MCGTLPLQLHAQDTARVGGQPEVTQLDEVTVTATRRSQGVQNVPLNVSVLTGDDIAQLGLTDLADFTRLIPGLYLVDQGGRDQNLLTVRGLNVSSLGASEGVGNSGGGVVGQYLGEVPLFINLHLLDLERVEALLGPQGTLYGAGTLGGAIRYIPVRPKFGETSLAVQAGTMALSHSEGLGSEGMLIGNFPVNDNTALRGALAYTNQPGFIDYDFLVRQPGVSNPEPDLSNAAAVAANLRRKRDVDRLETLTGRFALRHNFADTTDLNFTYWYQDEKSGGRTINQSASFGTGRYTSAERFEEPNDRRNQLVALELNADLGFADLVSATGFSRYDEDGQRDQTDLLLDFQYGYEDFPSFAAFTHETVAESRLNQEIRLVSKDTGSFNWIGGVFYNQLSSNATSSEFVPGFPQFIGVTRPDNLEYFQATFDEFKEEAVFGELGYKLTPNWRASAGLRWFRFADDQRVGFALPLIDGSPPNQVLPAFDSVNVSQSDTVYKLNTSYQFTGDLLAYATLSQGYRPGGSNAVPACADPLPPGQNVCALPNERRILPDKTLNHEVGLRTRWLGGKLIINTALFVVDWKDIQVAGTTVNGNIPITVNAAKARTSGVELAVRALVTANMRVTGNYSYNKAKLTSDAPGIVQGSDAFNGDRLPGSPEQQGNITIGYTHTLPMGLTLDASYGVSAQGRVFTKPGLRNNGEELSGYAVHDTSVEVSTDTWGLRLYAKNLLDKFAETGVRNDKSFIRTIDGDADGDGTPDHSFRLRRYYKSVLQPMTVGITFRYRFG